MPLEMLKMLIPVVISPLLVLYKYNKTHVMTEKSFIRLVPQLRAVAIRAGISAGVGGDAAEDVAQDTVIRLWQMCDDLERFDSPVALASIVARRLALNALRRSPSVALTDADHLQMAAPPSSQPDAQLQQRDDTEWLDRQLSQLPSTQQQVFYMRQVERRSHREIAQLVGISPASVCTLLARARHAIYEEIDKRR